MFLVMEIVFSEFKKQNNFDELKSKSSMEYFQNLPIASLKNQVQQQKMKKKTSLQKEFEQGPFSYYEFLGSCKRLQEKQQKMY